MSRLEEIRDRLEEITLALGSGDVSDSAAAELAGEAAKLTAEAANEAAASVERADRQG
ncbi:MAG: hypothetical protein KDB66_03060 [Solirubrobacterales bacterium]|nr:hypothetical protein [Solirubrobacterales bacterium]MCB8915284.1 hypothetical protein [Thermoleophilales bacterium]